MIVRYLDDILLLQGCICIEVGVILWNPIAAWIVGGLMLIALALLIGKAKSHATK